MDSLRSSVFCVYWPTSTTASGATKNANNWRVLSTVCFSAKNCYRHAEYLNQNFAWRDSVFTLPRKCPSIFWIVLNYKSLGTSFRIATINWNRTQGTLKFKVHLNRHSEVILSAHIARRYQGNIPWFKPSRVASGASSPIHRTIPKALNGRYVIAYICGFMALHQNIEIGFLQKANSLCRLPTTVLGHEI